MREEPLSNEMIAADVAQTRADAGEAPQKVLAALEFEAPYLIEKLTREGHAETSQEAAALFAEVKKYLVLAKVDERRGWHMYSHRIDGCWHQFILFTQQYIEFCQSHFGRYMPHAPSNAPKSIMLAPTEPTTFEQFRTRYEELFDATLPDAWYDHLNMTPDRRVANERVGLLSVRDQGEMAELVNARGEVLLVVSAIARNALAFISTTKMFYVRELPGSLDEEEKVALIAMLVEHRLLRLAP